MSPSVNAHTGSREAANVITRACTEPEAPQPDALHAEELAPHGAVAESCGGVTGVGTAVPLGKSSGGSVAAAVGLTQTRRSWPCKLGHTRTRQRKTPPGDSVARPERRNTRGTSILQSLSAAPPNAEPPTSIGRKRKHNNLALERRPLASRVTAGLRSGVSLPRTLQARVVFLAQRLREGRTVGRLLDLMHIRLISADDPAGSQHSRAVLHPRQGLFAQRDGGFVMIVNTFTRRGVPYADIAPLSLPLGPEARRTVSSV